MEDGHFHGHIVGRRVIWLRRTARWLNGIMQCLRRQGQLCSASGMPQVWPPCSDRDAVSSAVCRGVTRPPHCCAAPPVYIHCCCWHRCCSHHTVIASPHLSMPKKSMSIIANTCEDCRQMHHTISCRACADPLIPAPPWPSSIHCQGGVGHTIWQMVPINGTQCLLLSFLSLYCPPWCL